MAAWISTWALDFEFGQCSSGDDDFDLVVWRFFFLPVFSAKVYSGVLGGFCIDFLCVVWLGFFFFFWEFLLGFSGDFNGGLQRD